MIRAAIVGATGYTGYELIQILARHPDVALSAITARSDAGRPLSALYPTPLDLKFVPFDALDADALDVAFLALPHAASAEAAAALWALRPTLPIIDLSADFRLRDAATYGAWYHHEHPLPGALGEAVYGLTEFVRERLPGARLVANPGCYPTSILLALAPLLAEGLLHGATVIADAKSGVSGAGRGAKVANLFAELSEDFRPYAIGRAHRHVPEIEQEMAALAEGAGPRHLIFSPHLLPVTRGMLSTLYVPMPDGWDGARLRALYAERYGDEPFLWLLPEGETATLAHAVRTNRCVLSLHPEPRSGHLLIASAIDNLVKGAAGQAVQNMNVLFGLDERLGLFGALR